MEKKFLIVITHSSDAPERAGAALSIANTAVASGMDVVIFALNEGALLVKKGFAETVTDQKAFPPLKTLLDTLVEAGQKFFVCTACANQFGVGKDELLPNTEMAGPQTLLEYALEREVMTF
ncbi:MAG: DsrE family protein [Nitrospirae bacterium]|nr:DsrE family protein [Nitrospirota bacterium]